MSDGTVDHTGFFFASPRHTMDVTLGSNNMPATIDGASISYSEFTEEVGTISLPDGDSGSSMNFNLYDDNEDGVIDSAVELDANNNIVALYDVLWDDTDSNAITVDFTLSWSSYGDDYLWGEFLGNGMTLYSDPFIDWDAITGAVEDTANADSALSGDPGDSAILISGLDGDDTITGTVGGDWIYGDVGNDTMTGNGGADLFVFNTDDSDEDVDVITDFSATDGDVVLIDGSALFDTGSYDFTFETGTYTGSTFTAGTSGLDTAITFGSTNQIILLQGVDASKLVFADIEDSVAIWLHNV
jgi:Ca2+-binding RTX toxin-like protein